MAEPGHTVVTKRSVVEFIARNRLGESILCLHSSFRSFGEVEHGPKTIIDGFLEQGCTLVCPAFYDESHAPPPKQSYLQNGIDYSRFAELPQNSFSADPDQVEKSMGIVTRTLLRYPNSQRTKNPSQSFVVIGSSAGALTRGQSLLKAYSVYKNIDRRKENSFILLAGVDLTACTPIHFAEERAGRTLFRRWAVDHGKTVEVEVGSCSDGFEKIRDFTRRLEHVDVLGNSPIRIYPFRQFIETVSEVIRAHPEVTHCGHEDCLRCQDMMKGGRSALRSPPTVLPPPTASPTELNPSSEGCRTDGNTRG